MIQSALAFLLLAGPAVQTSSGDRTDHPVTLDEVVQRALSRNYNILIERESVKSATAGIRKAEGAYDFALNVQGELHNHTDPVNSLLSGAPAGKVAADLNQLEFDTSVSRLLPTGGTVSLLANGGRSTTNGLLSLLSPAYSSAFGLEVRQPLLRDRAIDPTRRAIRVARTERDRSVASLKRSVSDTVAAVESAYWSLSAAQRDVVVREAAVGLAREQLEETRSRISAGTLPENEEAQPNAELERRKGEFLASVAQALRGENDLKALVLDEGKDALWAERLVPSDAAETAIVPIDLATALSDAVIQRPEVDEAKAGVARQEIEIAATKDELKPRLDAYASYARRGLSGTLNPNAISFFGGPLVVPDDLNGSLGRSLGTIGDGLYPDTRIGVALTVPLGNRVARAGAAIAEAGERQAAAILSQTRQRIQVEVRNAAATLETAAERIGAARAGREAASIQFRSEKERYQVGLSTNFLVLTRQNDLSRAELDEIAALSDYRKARSEFSRAAGTLLRERQVVVEEAPAKAGAGGPR